jgi:AAA+ ATPase superfamily predicted ATPase
MQKMSKLFINRKEELKKLNTGLQSGDDFILVAPRRFGKTSLALKVLKEIKEANKAIVIDIDLMSYASGTVSSVAECILEKSLNALGFYGKIRQLWRNLDFSFNLKVKYQDLEIEPLLHMFNKGDEWQLLEESLNLPEKIALKYNKPVIVFYDEFGELSHLGDRVIKLFRSIIQRHEQVSYLFAGSQETVMNKIFLDKSGAFYRFGELIYLKELNKHDLYQYIIENYPGQTTSKGGLDDITIIDMLIDGLNGHPYYTAQALTYLKRNPKCSIEEFALFIKEELLERERGYLEQQLINISNKQHAIDILRILSLNLNPYDELDNVGSGQIYKVLRHLETSGYIYKYGRGNYKIIDPLMGMLLIKVDRFI